MYGFHYNFIKKNFDAELFLMTQTALPMKQNQKIFMKNFLSGKICLTLVTIEKIQSFLMRIIKKLLVK